MIRYFRINDPYRLVGLFLLLLILYLPIFISNGQVTIPELKALLLGEKLNEGYAMYSEVVDNSAPLAAWTHELLDSFFGRSVLVRHILSFLLIFLQSAYIGILFINKKVFSENTYIPSFFFGLLFFFSYDTLALSDELLGSGFLLLALTYMFQEIEFRNERDESVFNAGLCISLASLFSFAFIVYLPCAVIVFMLFTRSDVRKFLLLIFGFLLPHFLALSIAFLNNTTAEMWQYYYLPNLSFVRTVYVDVRTLLTLSAVPLLFLAISLVMLNREARFSKYQSQIMQTMVLWLAFSVLFVLYTKDLRPQSLIVFIPSLTFLFTHFFLLIRRNKFVQLNSWLLFLGIITVAYLARFGKLDWVDYDRLTVDREPGEVRGKRILVLDSTFDPYHDNFLATPFLEWRLSQEIFRNADYYDHVVRVYRSFKNDPPDLIMDEHDLLDDFFRRMPDIASLYDKDGNRYIRRTSN